MFGKLLESSIGLSMRYYSNQAYEIAVGIFHQVERFGFGYTREFVQDPKVMLQKLISEARSSEEGYSAPVAVPRYTQNGYSSDSMTIPPNTMIIFDLHALAKGEQYWTNPNEFEPTRFLQVEPQHVDEEGAMSVKNNHPTIGQFPFVPFSVGMRNCPAVAVTEVLFKVAIAKFVSDYQLQFVKKDADDSTLHISSKDKSFEYLAHFRKSW
ncbi:TPA: cytochrome P450 [Legionella bozemanae]